MKNNSKDTDFDVILVGYGPVSKVAALLLDRLGWKVAVFERWHEVYPLPRAVCIDHEVYRLLHAGGLGQLVDKVVDIAPVYRWYNANWQELIMLDWPGGSVSGTSEVNFIHQPSFERELDAEVKRRNNISVFFEHDCIEINQHKDCATVTVKDLVSQEVKCCSAKYIIGADGANSIVRESLHINRVDLGFEADWLVVDYMLNDGLSAVDLGLVECGQYCNPERPTTIVPGGKVNGCENRRWEFMRLPHETKEEMLNVEKVHSLLGDWIKPEQGELVRHALYTFRSLVAEQWRKNRILLAGDAAHVMPPFMGQGMCAGLRDVWNLIWKLDSVLRGEAEESLLDTYEKERKPHVTDVIKLSMFLGNIICIPDQEKAAQRDALFLSENRPQMQPFPHLTGGFIAQNEEGQPLPCAGLLSPHGTVRYQRRTARLDRFTDSGKFKLIINNDFAAQCLDDNIREMLTLLDIQTVVVADKCFAKDNEYADTQGQILSFMNTHNVKALLVRPDHYLFAAAGNKTQLDDMLEQLARQLEQYGLCEAVVA